MSSEWTTCGPDTIHLTYKHGPNRTPQELAQLLGEFQALYDLPTDPRLSDRGIQGFAHAVVDKSAGLRMDWTEPEEDGNNPGCFTIQVGGVWFQNADGETTADFLQFLDAYQPLRCTRIDFQQTTETKRYLTPFWINKFNSGAYRVIGRKHFEPRGNKNAAGEYPDGATLYHGSRKSERFARQYDKHLQQQYGPPRRRDEIEAKGQSARDLWEGLLTEINTCEQQGVRRGVTLGSYAKRTIRAFLPIRDTSPWAGKDLPPKWTLMAKEPKTWASLFEEEALEVKPRERRVTSMLKSYRYAMSNFGASMSAMFAVRIVEGRRMGLSDKTTLVEASIAQFVDAIREANPDRVKDFLMELPPEEAVKCHQEWLNLYKAISEEGGAEKISRM